VGVGLITWSIDRSVFEVRHRPDAFMPLSAIRGLMLSRSNRQAAN
jgi:hypothetical protein